MEKCYNGILFKLEVAINDLEVEADYSIQRIETAIKFIIDSLSELKEFVIKKDFKSIQEEIHFLSIKTRHCFKTHLL
jgi:hypothetical protein